MNPAASAAASYNPPPYIPKNARHSGSYGSVDEEAALLTESPEDDFKYGTTVSQCDQTIKHAFIRKVYSILFLQILGSMLVGLAMNNDTVKRFLFDHIYFIFIPMIASIVSLVGVLYWRQSHPKNIILLGLFTLFEAISIGFVVVLADNVVVLKALLITVIVFLGLTLFTFQSSYDFSKLGSILFFALFIYIITSFIGVFFPFSSTMEMIYSGGGVLIFSGYILYDTHMLCKRLAPDEWVMACVSLYLDALNLFLSILRFLNSSSDN